MESEWGLQSLDELVLSLEDFNWHVGKWIDGFQGVLDGYGVGRRNVEGRRLLKFCDGKELCIANMCLEKKEQRKITYSMGGNETEIDFVLVAKNNRKYLKEMKTIPRKTGWQMLSRSLVCEYACLPNSYDRLKPNLPK